MKGKLKNYKIIKKGFFTNLTKFEEKLNDYANKGYVIISISSDSGEMFALIAKQKVY